MEMIIRRYNVNNEHQNKTKKKNTVFTLCIAQLTLNYDSLIPDYHMPFAIQLNCAA